MTSEHATATGRFPVPPTTAISDVLAIHGLGGCLSPPLRRFVTGLPAVSGPVTTVAMAPAAPHDGSAFESLYSLLDTDLTDSVVVVGGAEDADGAVWGQILSRAAQRHGARAAIVAGGVRDRSELHDEGIVVWALAEHTVGAIGRARVVGVDEPVAIAGHLVRPGDLAVVDDGGAVVLPVAMSAALLDDAREYADAEGRVLSDLEAGCPLVESYDHKRLVGMRLRERSRSVRPA